jgi:replicative DNA helicase
MVLRAAQEGHPIAVYSLEMSRIQLTARLVAMLSGISSFRLLQERLLPGNVQAVGAAAQSLGRSCIYFDDRSTSSLDTIITSIRTMKLRYDIRGAVVDYLQILNVNQSDRLNPEQAMAQAARRLKNLAKELNIWVMALSQLSRSKDNPEPTLNRLRDSGQIAEAADVVMLVYRPEAAEREHFPQPYADFSVKGTALIKVAKGRNTGPYSFICRFDSERTLFEDYPNPTLAKDETQKKNNEPKLPF